MRWISKAIACASFFTAAITGVQAQTVDAYGFYYRTGHGQSGDSVPTAGQFSHGFYVEARGSGLESFSSPNFDGPANSGTSLFTTPNGLTISRTFLYSDSGLRDSQHPTGDYTLNLASSSMLTLSSGAFGNVAQVTGGIWSGDRLQVTDGGYNLTFNAPSGVNYVRLYIYQQGGAFESFYFEGDGSTSSFFLPDSVLELGINYGAALDFVNVVDTDTAFGGAVGQAGYMNRTEFGFAVVAAAVPEPAEFGMLAGVVALAVTARRRRRQVANGSTA